MSNHPDDTQKQTSPTPPLPPQAPAAPQPPVPPAQPQYVQPAVSKPGEGLAIASLITSLLGIGLVGLILGIISFNETKKAGYPKNGMAIAGVIISAVQIALVVIVFFFFFLAALVAGTSSSLTTV